MVCQAHQADLLVWLSVLTGEVLCTEPVEGVPTVVHILGYLLRLVYPTQWHLDNVGDP